MATAQPIPGSVPVSSASAGDGLRSWLVTVDHKRIGIMYLITTLFFFLTGGLMALVIRLQLETNAGTVVSPDRYDEIFTMHGTTMIFLFVVPVMAAFGNYFVPLQIGARDMAFPKLNAASFWLLLFGGIAMYSSFLFGGASGAGWTAYPPLSVQLPGHGVDFWIVGLHIIGLSSLLGAINFICTIHNMRAPGMRLTRMPLFTWCIDFYSIMILAAGPVFAGALTMLLLDRNFGTSFYDPHTGSPILYQHLFWFYSHPVVYVMALPGFGMISEIIPVFSRKPLFGYKALVYSVAAIAFMGFLVWGHHMFATNFPGPVNAWFILASVAIGVPTGVKIFNWIGTMWMGRIRFEPPMLFAVGFIGLFLIGGLSGLFLASPVDLQVTDTYFVVAHFHYVLGTVPVFAVIGGLHYWYPKMTGRMMNRSLAIWSFWVLFVGFNLTFFPMHAAGLSGMPRRISSYPTHPGWELMNQLSTLGSFVLSAGVLMVVYNCITSLRNGRVAGNDPWQANTLEWYTTSPPPAHNFDSLPAVRSERPLYDLRRELAGQPPMHEGTVG
jgi:cytochrome c oxidase subunit I